MTSIKRKQRLLVSVNDLLLAGVQRLAIDQITHADRSRFEIHLVTLMQFPGRDTFYDQVPNDVMVHRLSFTGLADLPSWIALIKLLSRIRPDVVKSATFFSNTIFLVLRPWFGYGVVAAEHNSVRAKPWWQRTLDQLLLPQACTVVADSKQVAAFVSESEQIAPEHFTVVYNGIDLAAIEAAKKRYASDAQALRSSYAIPEDAHVFFTAARLVRQKNHALMIEAFHRLHKQRSNVYLLIAGEGSLRHELESQIQELGLIGKAILVGEHKDIHRYYVLADSFLLTSLHEGFCIAAMEALAFGLPVVSTRVGGIEEYLRDGENGFFTEAEPEAIASTLERLLALPEDARTRMKTAGEQTATEYSVERYGNTMNNLMEQCCVKCRR